jgi:hypothetical protein
MACERVPMPTGGFLWLCTSPGPPPGCIVCGEPSARLCDGPDPEDVDGVCSAALCDRHTHRRGDVDLCPRHAPTQLDLFGRAPARAAVAPQNRRRPR